MSRIRRIREKTNQKWQSLPNHHQLAVTVGIIASFLLIVWLVSINLIQGRSRATSTDVFPSPTPNPPSPLIFRAIVEDRQPKHLIIRGTISGSRGKVCFAEVSSNTSNCQIEFPVLAWSHLAVRAELPPNTATTGKVWLITGERSKSNQLEVSF